MLTAIDIDIVLPGLAALSVGEFAQADAVVHPSRQCYFTMHAVTALQPLAFWIAAFQTVAERRVPFFSCAPRWARAAPCAPVRHR